MANQKTKTKAVKHDNLILTGTGYIDYDIAAALALRHYQVGSEYNADVRRVEATKLPDELKKVCGYKEVVILGIGMSNKTKIFDALEELQKKNVSWEWLSAVEFPEHILNEVKQRFQKEFFIEGDGSITNTVEFFYNIKCDDALKPLIEEEAPTDDDYKYLYNLIGMAKYQYDEFQNPEFYSKALRHIARMSKHNEEDNGKNKSLGKPEKDALEQFKKYGDRRLFGTSENIRDLRNIINQVAQSDVRIVVYGASGTGKEAVACLTHLKSKRKDGPFIAFNCASVNPNLLESRFQGVTKGAFTGADEDKPGLFELANGGTLFLDEIGELPLEAQSILLRVLEVNRVLRMGSKDGKETPVDVRLIAATNRNLAQMVNEGKFRGDLFYRLNVAPIQIAPLCERKEDIETIVKPYWLKIHKHRLEDDQIAALKEYDYPGNVRELKNLLDRANALGIKDFANLIKEHKEKWAIKPLPETSTMVEYPDDYREAGRVHVIKILKECGGNKSKAAKRLGIVENTITNIIGNKGDDTKK